MRRFEVGIGGNYIDDKLDHTSIGIVSAESSGNIFVLTHQNQMF